MKISVRLQLEVGDARDVLRGGLTSQMLAEWAKAALLARGLLSRVSILDVEELTPAVDCEHHSDQEGRNGH
jgi:hypothetical protein